MGEDLLKLLGALVIILALVGLGFMLIIDADEKIDEVKEVGDLGKDFDGDNALNSWPTDQLDPCPCSFADNEVQESELGGGGFCYANLNKDNCDLAENILRTKSSKDWVERTETALFFYDDIRDKIAKCKYTVRACRELSVVEPEFFVKLDQNWYETNPITK